VLAAWRDRAVTVEGLIEIDPDTWAFAIGEIATASGVTSRSVQFPWG
jgi:hypothetical protein